MSWLCWSKPRYIVGRDVASLPVASPQFRSYYLPHMAIFFPTIEKPLQVVVQVRTLPVRCTGKLGPLLLRPARRHRHEKHYPYLPARTPGSSTEPDEISVGEILENRGALLPLVPLRHAGPGDGCYVKPPGCHGAVSLWVTKNSARSGSLSITSRAYLEVKLLGSFGVSSVSIESHLMIS